MKIYILLIMQLLLAGCATQQEISKNINYASKIKNTKLDADFSCAGTNKKETSREQDFVIRANSDGLLLDPKVIRRSQLTQAFSKPLPIDEAQEKMRHIICRAENLAAKKKSSDVKVLIYIHGGLNNFGDTDKRVNSAIPEAIMLDTKDWHYPVFLSWPSDAPSTWVEQTFRIREGKKANKFVGVISSPFIFTADILRSIGNFPATASYQIANEKDRIASRYFETWLSQSWEDSILKFCDKGMKPCHSKPIYTRRPISLSANLSDYNASGPNVAASATWQTITFPVRYTVGSLWHSGISGSAWDNMKRRSQNITYPVYEFDSRESVGLNAGMFFELLLNRADLQQKQGINYHVTLVGHSMGTIVINHVLTRYNERWATTPYLKNIVFMAAAATIGDSLSSLSPVLKPQKNRRSPDFYNLTLNRVAEVSETHVGGAVPTGSLLVSIDQHHDKPEHPLNRTMGSEVNVLSSIEIIDEALTQSDGKIVLKSFDSNRDLGTYPTKHGDFGLIPFWRKATWKLNSTGEGTLGAPFTTSIYDEYPSSRIEELRN